GDGAAVAGPVSEDGTVAQREIALDVDAAARGGARIRQVIADIAAGDGQRPLIPQAAAADGGDVAGDGGVGDVGGSLDEDGPAAVAAVGGVGCERTASNRRRRVRGLHADGTALGRGGITGTGTVG